MAKMHGNQYFYLFQHISSLFREIQFFKYLLIFPSLLISELICWPIFQLWVADTWWLFENVSYIKWMSHKFILRFYSLPDSFVEICSNLFQMPVFCCFCIYFWCFPQPAETLWVADRFPSWKMFLVHQIFWSAGLWMRLINCSDAPNENNFQNGWNTR